LTYLSIRYAYPWWREKEIDSKAKRSEGLCPLTPEETSLVLKALGFGKDTLVYIAAGEIYGGEKRLEPLRAAFPKLVSVHNLILSSEILLVSTKTSCSFLLLAPSMACPVCHASLYGSNPLIEALLNTVSFR
jgi:hypothetical protein